MGDFGEEGATNTASKHDGLGGWIGLYRLCLVGVVLLHVQNVVEAVSFLERVYARLAFVSPFTLTSVIVIVLTDALLVIGAVANSFVLHARHPRAPSYSTAYLAVALCLILLELAAGEQLGRLVIHSGGPGTCRWWVQSCQLFRWRHGCSTGLDPSASYTISDTPASFHQAVP
ncbi:MAG: hypothetical protein U0163_05335 [Gemmatimonadaceae bacterium]